MDVNARVVNARVLNIPGKMLQYLSLIWVIGILIFLIIKLLAWIHFSNEIKKQSKPLNNDEISGIFQQVKKELGIRSQVRFYENCQMITPMLCGLIKPVVLIPKIDLTKEEWRFVFLHELIHLRRRDLWWKTATVVANAIHWFNPFAYYVFRNMDKSCEQACDEVALSMIEPTNRKSYGITILNILEYSVMKKEGLHSALTDSKNNVKTRLRLIANYKRSRPCLTIFSYIVAAFITTLSALPVMAVISVNSVVSTSVTTVTWADEDISTNIVIISDK